MVTPLNTEIHPEWYRDIKPMKFLILGSFPPHSLRWDYPFYYPNSQNRFWYILADIAGTKLRYTKDNPEMAVEERFEIMKKLQTGVQNMGLEIRRKGTSARDTDIEIIRNQNILSILSAHPELECILLPGYSANASTAPLFLKYMGRYISSPENINLKAGTIFSINFENRNIRCVVLNSTSTAARIPYEKVLLQFAEHLAPETI